MKIAIIGWGSLLWDKDPFFDSKHGDWKEGGPLLPLEFSRISRSRGGILTPVVDTRHGELSPTAYCLSNREDFMDTVCDLRQREGCLYKYVGWSHLGPRIVGDPCPNFEVYRQVINWQRANDIEMAVWTGLQPNFQRTTNTRFSISAAMDYLNNLPTEMKLEFSKYVEKLPRFATTPLLEHIRTHYDWAIG